MAEWFKAPVLKTGVGQLTVGSNPSLSARTGLLLFQNGNPVFYSKMPCKSFFKGIRDRNYPSSLLFILLKEALIYSVIIKKSGGMGAA